MNKKIIVLLLIAAFVAVLLPSAALAADGRISLNLGKTYPPDTYPGTFIKVFSTVQLQSGESIAYFLNGEQVGTASAPGEFTFTSVAGDNLMIAKIVRGGDAVVSESEPLLLSFTPFTVRREFANVTFDDGELPKADFMELDYSTKNGYGLSVVKDEQTNDNVMKLSTKSEEIMFGGVPITIGTAAGNWFMMFPGTYMENACINGWAVFDFDIKFDNFTTTNRLFYIKTAGGGEYVGPTVDAGSGNLLFGGGGSKTLSINTWYNMKSVINLKDKTADFYMNGELIDSDRELPPNFINILYYNSPRFMSYDYTNYSTCYLDNMKLYNVVENYTVAGYTRTADGQDVTGLDDFPLSGASALLSFSQKMNAIEKEDITFTVDGVKIDFDFSYDQFENTVLVTPKKSFNGREMCKISFDNVLTENGVGTNGKTYVEFAVASPGYGLEYCTHAPIAPNCKLNMKVKVSNATNEDRTGIILAAIYREGRLVSVAMKNTQLNMASSEEYDLDIDVPIEYNKFDSQLIIYLIADETFFAYDMLRD